MLKDACKHFVWDFWYLRDLSPTDFKDRFRAHQAFIYIFWYLPKHKDPKLLSWPLPAKVRREPHFFLNPILKSQPPDQQTSKLLSKQTSAAAAWRARAMWAPRTTCWGVRSLVCARESRKGHPQGDTICSRALQDLLCEAWFSRPTRWMLKRHQICCPDLLAARICASSTPCTGFSRQLPACFCSLLLLLHFYTQILL